MKKKKETIRKEGSKRSNRNEPRQRKVRKKDF